MYLQSESVSAFTDTVALTSSDEAGKLVSRNTHPQIADKR